MRQVFSYAMPVLFSIVVFSGCAEGPNVVVIKPGDDAQEKAVTALIKAKPGDIIEFAEGTFNFTQGLRLEDVPNVTIRGKGEDKTILNFKDQAAGGGGEGILVTSGPFTIHDLRVQDTIGDAVKVTKVTGVTFRNVRVEWTRGPHEDNGAYGVYPVLCKDVLVEHCTVTDCSDAGIYVGQSKNVIVRHCRAERNVAGIEIENTVGADVYDNVATNNAGGILVFSLPGLPEKLGSHCRVYDNEVYENNHRNFAKVGNIVATVPPGSGMIVMANDQVEIFNNKIKDNQTANVSVISFLATARKFEDPGYDPYCEAIYIHDNEISGGGANPGGELGKFLAPAFDGKLPDIIVDTTANKDKLVDGKLPEDLRIYIKDNGDAEVALVNFVGAAQAVAMGGAPKIIRDPAEFEGVHPPLDSISIIGLDAEVE